MLGANQAEAIRRMFDDESPILVEVAFGFASSDWYLIEEFEEFANLFNSLAGDFPVRLMPVGSLKSEKTVALNPANHKLLD